MSDLVDEQPGAGGKTLKPPAPSDRVITRDFVIVTLTGLFALMGFSSTLPLVPRYMENELGASKVEIGIALGIFSISALLARPYVGKLGDTRGRRFIIVAGTALTALSVAAHALAVSVPLMLVIRLAMGATQGAFFVGTATLVNDLAPPHRRGEATSYFSVAIYAGMAFGPLMGELVEDAAGFKWAFVAGGVCLVMASFLALLLPPHRPVRIAGSPAPSGKWLHPAAIGPGLVLMCGIVSFVALNGFMPLYVEEFDLGKAGPVFVTYGLLVLVIRLAGSKLPDKLGTVRTTILALVGQAVGMAMMGGWNTKAGLYAGAVVLAVGGSFLYPALLTAAIANVDASERARATGTFSMAFELSAGLGGPILGWAASFGGNRATFFASAIAAVAGLPLLYGWATRHPTQIIAGTRSSA
ncbi:MAG: MFS transporter [Acidimicrobiales bacterium]